MKWIMILTIFIMILPADTKTLVENNISNDLTKKLKFLIMPKENKYNHFLIPTDTTYAFKVFNSTKTIYNRFIEQRKILKKEKKRNALYKLYLYSFEKNSEDTLTDIAQLVLKSSYEMRILKNLNEDIDEAYIVNESQELILSEIKNLLHIDKKLIYKTQINQNILYAQNIKKYLSLSTGVSQNLIEESDVYIYFLKLLNEGEKLIHDGIDINSFTKFEKFMDDIEVTQEDIENLLTIEDKNLLMDTYIKYWVRGQVYGRYLGLNLNELSKMIEKEKIFFEEL